MSCDVSRCPVCGSPGQTKYGSVSDRLLGIPGTWHLTRCMNGTCDAHWLNPRPDSRELRKYYEGYHTHQSAVVRKSLMYRFFWPTPLSARERSRRFSFVSERTPVGRALEIGCGNGRNLRLLQHDGWEVVGQDLDPEAANAASQLTGTDVFSTPIDDCPFDDASFDVILTSHVLEHVDDAHAFLATVYRLLAPGGTSVNFTPNGSSISHRMFGSRWRGIEAPRHLVLFGPKSAEAVFASAGFASVEVSAFGLSGGVVAMESLLAPRLGDLRFLRPFVAVAGQLIEDLVGIVSPMRRWELSIRATKT